MCVCVCEEQCCRSKILPTILTNLGVQRNDKNAYDSFNACCIARTINTLITTRYIMLFGMCCTVFHFGECVHTCTVLHTRALVCGYCTNIFRIYDFILLFTQRDTNKEEDTHTHTGNLAVISTVRWAFITYFVALSFHSFSFAPDVRVKYCVCVCVSIARENLQTTR